MSTTAIRERPILFQGEMVRALRDRRKTQTRRIVKHLGDQHGNYTEHSAWPNVHTLDDGSFMFSTVKNRDFFPANYLKSGGMVSPYGVVGEHLWVREAWRAETDWVVGNRSSQADIRYAADGENQRQSWMEIPEAEQEKWTAWLSRHVDGKDRGFKPSIHMPRWASRIDLLIESVRVERVQDISEEDAIAEGAEKITYGCVGNLEGYRPLPGAMIASHALARDWYKSLWESINGPGSWASNPWVWVVGFKVIRGGA